MKTVTERQLRLGLAGIERCVEIADLGDGGRAVRDSKDPAGSTLTVTTAGWTAFTTGLRHGEFD